MPYNLNALRLATLKVLAEIKEHRRVDPRVLQEQIDKLVATDTAKRLRMRTAKRLALVFGTASAMTLPTLWTVVINLPTAKRPRHYYLLSPPLLEEKLNQATKLMVQRHEYQVIKMTEVPIFPTHLKVMYYVKGWASAPDRRVARFKNVHFEPEQRAIEISISQAMGLPWQWYFVPRVANRICWLVNGVAVPVYVQNNGLLQIGKGQKAKSFDLNDPKSLDRIAGIFTLVQSPENIDWKTLKRCC